MCNPHLSISLVSMPQAPTAMPSIGLTQLASVIKMRYPTSVDVQLAYANLDFVRFVGVEDYKTIAANRMVEWIFRREAFPDADDNIDALSDFLFSSGKTLLRSRLFDLVQRTRSSISTYLADLIAKYDLMRYDLVGFTSMMCQTVPSMALANRIKAMSPACTVVMGGASCAYPMGGVLVQRAPQLDYVFSGPALDSFPRFVESLLNDDTDGTNEIDGVLSKANVARMGRGRSDMRNTSHGGDRQLNPFGGCYDIDTCVQVDYDDFTEVYDEFCKDTGCDRRPLIPFETGRGCWKRDKVPCTFCGLIDTGRVSARMKPELAVGYVNALVDKYSTDAPMFCAVDSIMPRDYLKAVVPRLDIPDNITVQYETTSSLSRSDLLALSSARIKIIQPGIESLSTPVLRLMKKGVTAFSNIRLLKNCIEVGVYPIWNLLYGVPGEADDSVVSKLVKDLPRLRHLPPPSSFMPVDFVRFSAYFENPEEFGLNLRPDPMYALLYPFGSEDVFNLAYFYHDTNRDSEYVRIRELYSSEATLGILEWLSSFRNADNIPQLYFVDQRTVYDSRDDIEDPAMHDISFMERQLLDYLKEARDVEAVRARFKATSRAEFDNALANIDGMGLLFEEEGKFMSLVCSCCAWDREEYRRMIDFVSLTTANED